MGVQPFPQTKWRTRTIPTRGAKKELSENSLATVDGVANSAQACGPSEKLPGHWLKPDINSVMSPELSTAMKQTSMSVLVYR